jgi:pimeloyl-ACP methyl ester carboxylesterase
MCLVSSLFSLFIEDHSIKSDEELLRLRAPISGLIAENNFGFQRRIFKSHVFMETGSGQPIIFCHGLFGSFRNFAEIGKALAHKYRVLVPCMPMYDAPLKKCTVEELSVYLHFFIEDLGLENVILAGNSMGGGTVLNYATLYPHKVNKILLFSSSGLSFIPMRGGAMKLKDFNYVKNLLMDIFYDGSHITDEEVREVYNVMQNKQTLLRCLSFTRSTKRNYLHDKLKGLPHPTLILWGKEDNVTPPFIAEEFKSHLKNSTLHYLDHCGHCAPYEKPLECLAHIEAFFRAHADPPFDKPLSLCESSARA